MKTPITLSNKQLEQSLIEEIQRYRKKNKIVLPPGISPNQLYIEDLCYVEKFIYEYPFYPSIQGKILLEHLTGLKELYVRPPANIAPQNIDSIVNKSELTTLEINHQSIATLDLSQFPNLQRLSITRCENLTKIDGLNKLENLDEITIFDNLILGENDICKFLVNNMKRQASLTIDTLYYPRIRVLIRDKISECRTSFLDAMWKEDIGCGNVNDSQTYPTKIIGRMYGKLESILKRIGISRCSSDLEEIYIIYKWICENIKYDHRGLADSSRRFGHSGITSGPRITLGQKGSTNGAFNAITYHTVVCQGYTKTFQMFLKLRGIDSYDLPAHCDSVFQKNAPSPTPNQLLDSPINHSIIKVVLDGGEYYCDATNDAALTQRNKKQSQMFFMKTQGELTTNCYPVNDKYNKNTQPLIAEQRNRLSSLDYHQTENENAKFIERKATEYIEKSKLHLSDFEGMNEEAIHMEYGLLLKLVEELMLLGFISTEVETAMKNKIGLEFRTKLESKSKKTATKK